MTTKAEQNKRDMYDLLSSMRKAKKHPRLLARFESALESHLEDLREWKGRAEGFREERDQIQARLQAVDHSYFEQSQRNGEQARQIEKLEEVSQIAGEELIRVQEIARSALDDAAKARNQLSDVMVLVRRQRSAIGRLYMMRGEIKLQPVKLHPLCRICLDSGKVWNGLYEIYCTCVYGKNLRESNPK